MASVFEGCLFSMEDETICERDGFYFPCERVAGLCEEVEVEELVGKVGLSWRRYFVGGCAREVDGEGGV